MIVFTYVYENNLITHVVWPTQFETVFHFFKPRRFSKLIRTTRVVLSLLVCGRSRVIPIISARWSCGSGFGSLAPPPCEDSNSSPFYHPVSSPFLSPKSPAFPFWKGWRKKDGAKKSLIAHIAIPRRCWYRFFSSSSRDRGLKVQSGKFDD